MELNTGASRDHAWSVPANLLVAGEYAITRPGGIGIALTMEPRAGVHVHVDGDSGGDAPSARDRRDTDRAEAFRRAFLAVAAGKQDHVPGLSVHAVMPEDTLPGPAGQRESLPRVAQPVIAEIATFLQDIGTHRHSSFVGTPPATRITLDTTAFFDEISGRKLGFGSSAAATVLLTSAMLHLVGIDPLHNRSTVLGLSVRAHRQFQGGRGSGYDVTSSIIGGPIRIVGGETPRWEKLDLVQRWQDNGIGVFSWSGDHSVPSREAVHAFDKRFPPGPRSDAFLERSNAIVELLSRAGSWEALRRSIGRARKLSRCVGDAIGVPADIPAPLLRHISTIPELRKDRWTAKCTGAGNERVLVFADRRIELASSRLRAFQLESEGLRKEPAS